MTMVVSDFMRTHLVSVHPETLLSDAVRLMLEHRRAGLPVLDDKRRLLGMLLENDLMRRVEAGAEDQPVGRLRAFFFPPPLAEDYIQSHGFHVEDLMRWRRVSIKPTARLPDAVKAMLKNGIACVPVLAGKTLVGTIDQQDVLRALIRKLVEPKQKTSSDQEIHDNIMKVFGRERWAPKSGIDVTVDDGIVSLEGTAFSRVERTAIRVVAESVAGVNLVRDKMIMSYQKE